MITIYTFGPNFGLPDSSPFVTKALVLLKMSGVPFKAEAGGAANLRKAPKGKLPYIDDGGTIIADSTFIRFHLEKKYGIDFDKGLSAEERAAGWAIEKMCEDHLYWAVVESRWMNKANFDKGPRRFFDRAPAPLRPLIIAQIRRSIKRTLYGQGLGHHQRSGIEMLAIRDLDALSALIGTKPFLFGAEPHAADATVFAFVAGCATPYFTSAINDHALKTGNLTGYAARGMARWFPELASKVS